MGSVQSTVVRSGERRAGKATGFYFHDAAANGGLEGWDDLSFQSEKDGGGRRKSDAQPKAGRAGPDGSGGSAPSKKKPRPDSPEVGSALRTVYQRTIDEDIPPEMLDLLGKLG
jgi:hypothetical protein